MTLGSYWPVYIPELLLLTHNYITCSVTCSTNKSSRFLRYCEFAYLLYYFSVHQFVMTIAMGTFTNGRQKRKAEETFEVLL